MPRRSVPVQADELFDYAPAHRPPSRPSYSRFQPTTRSLHRTRRGAVTAASATVCVTPGTLPPDSADTFEWSTVDALMFPGPAPTCPICLDDLCAPRVTRCGHILDHVCALQLLHHAALDNALARCPLCSERVQVADLRAVDFLSWSPPVVGGIAKMSLVARPRHSQVARPFLKDSVHDATKLPSSFRPDGSSFSRLVVADTDYLLDNVAIAICGLEDTLREDPSLKPFVDSAKATWKAERDSLRNRRRTERLRAMSQMSSSGAVVESGGSAATSVKQVAGTASSSSCAQSSPVEQKDRCTRPERKAGTSNRRVAVDAGKDCLKNERGNNNGGKPSSLITRQPEILGMHVFFQASDGQRVFLLPLCDRIIKSEFSADYSTCSQTIECPIIEVERHMMDETLRKRYGFLRHLPLGCEFTFVEVDLSAVVSESTLAGFATELAERNVVRRRRAKKSEREDKLAADHEKESLRTYFKLSDRRLASLREDPKVDSNDETCFPPMPITSASDASSAGSPDKSGTGVSPPHGDSMIWGATVSSYSAATSNMGVFPTLRAVVTASSSTAPDEENSNSASVSALSQERPGMTPTRAMMTPGRFGLVGHGSSAMPPKSSPSSPRGAWGEPASTSAWGERASAGAWASSPNDPSPTAASPRRTPGTQRRGRKQKTVLSTAGPQYHRK